MDKSCPNVYTNKSVSNIFPKRISEALSTDTEFLLSKTEGTYILTSFSFISLCVTAQIHTRMALQEYVVGFRPLFSGVVFLFFITLILLWLKKDSRLNTIDGPRGWPIIGIGFELPPKSPEVFKNWARQYGEIFKLRVGMNNWVVVNTPEGVKEIFDKQVSS